MQELWKPVYCPKKGCQPPEQICLVPLVGGREEDGRADIRVERVQYTAVEDLVL